MIHGRTGAVLVPHLKAAQGRLQRMRGLIGRAGLPPGGGLLIENCSCIHTCFMKFPVDLLFLGRDGSVVKLVADVRPWRLSAAWRGCSVVELPTGALNRLPLAVGDRVHIERD